MITLVPTGRLEELATLLADEGLRTRLIHPIGRPLTLHVINPRTIGLEENIILEDGWFRWSWDERIAPASELPLAAASISRVLDVIRRR